MELEIEVSKAQKGDKEAFVNCIKACESSLYRVAKSILKEDSDCADAIQESILKAFHSLGSLREVSYFKTWLTRILINESRIILKERKKIVPIEKIENRHSSNSYQQIEMQEMVALLEEDLRIIVTLYYIEDLPVKEISLVLEQPIGTVKSRLSRARLKLAELYNLQFREETVL